MTKGFTSAVRPLKLGAMKQSLKRIGLLAVFCLFTSHPAKAVDGVYLGGVLGATGFTGAATGDTALTFGVDLGLQASSLVDVMFHFQTSSHTGATLYAPTMSAEMHWAQVNDFDFTIGFGPGMYFVKSPLATTSNFGINFGTAADLKIDDAIRLGMGVRYNVVFSGTNFYSVLFRFGYLFGF